LGFVNDLVRRIGFPVWNKTLLKLPDNNLGNNTRSAGSGETILYIPFVKDNTGFVNSVLIVKYTATSTYFRLIYAEEYSNFGFSNVADTLWNAKKVFNIFARLEKNVFGHTKFQLLDERIFAGTHGVTESGKTWVKLKNGTQNCETCNYISVEICEFYDICHDPSGNNNECPDGGCYYGCDYWVSEESICTTIWIWIGSGGSGGGSDGGGEGGGSGGGGGSTPSNWWDDPCEEEIGGRAVPCDEIVGWESVADTLPQNNESIDSMLTRYSIAINSKADSLMTISLDSMWEWTTTIVSVNNNVIAKYDTTLRDSIRSEANFNLQAGEILLGILHTHPRSSSNPLDRSAPSGGDIAYLKLNLSQNFVQFIECGNVRFALVIENAAKATQFFNSLIDLT